jgi:tRNA1(Val) A37 N6-methylase TrmN6
MALMFPRLAQNFIKNGYFPTDEATLSRILTALDIGAGTLRIFDPCCGEGVALAEARHHLVECGATVQALGVEYDAERAWHAKRLLDTVLHSDINDVVYSARSMGLLFLNPPYGDVVSDKAQTGDNAKRERLEKIFFRRTFGALRYGGILVLIVPHYVLDGEFANLIARNFERVHCAMAPETRFKQAVVIGVRKRSDRPDPAVAKSIQAFGRGEHLQDVLPEVWSEAPYLVPEADLAEADWRFHAVRIDAAQLDAELQRFRGSTLWPNFATHFGQVQREHRRPLRAMRPWHLALALAAGQICGEVRALDGRVLLVKGDTYKSKRETVDVTTHDDGSITETRTLTDVFVPVIRGLEFTPGPQLGAIVTIS